MPIALGGPSLSKPKKLVVKPYNPQAYVPGGSSPAVARAIQSQGFGVPRVAVPTIPSASSIVARNSGASAAPPPSSDPYGDELRGDQMYSIGQKNYQDALDMGRRTVLSDPINRLIQTYGYDPRTTGLGDLASQYFDPAGLDAARAGGYTTAQQIEHGFGQALASVPGQLAERGLLGSGGSAIIGNRLNYERGLNDKNAIDQLLSGIGTANQNWTDFQSDQANTWRAAQEAIATRLGQQQGYHGAAGQTGPVNTDDALYNPDTYPFLNAAAPSQVSTPVTVGSSTSFEPKPTAGNYVPVSTATKKTLNKVKAKAQAPSGWAHAIAGMTGW